MQQQTLLPFVLKGTATIATSPVDDDSLQDLPITFTQKRDSRMGAVYSVPASELTNSELERHKRALTMTPIDSGYSVSGATTFYAYELTCGRFNVPRFYGVEHWGEAHINELSLGAPMSATAFQGTLNPVQVSATEDTLKQLLSPPNGALLVLPCGYGKTVCALWLAHKLGRRTLVLVHKAFLVSQWQERAASFLPGASVGKIQQNIADVDADIVVGMVHSISKREYAPEVLSVFGTVIIDEAHHMSAPFFSKALRKNEMTAKYILGLSATPERKDGLTPLLYFSMGSIAHRIERKPEHTLVSCLLYENSKRKEIKMRDGRVSVPLMLNALVVDNKRNELIADHIVRCICVGRHVIVLTDRLVQLTELHKLLLARGLSEEQVAFYVGSTSADERERACECACILSTYSMAKEGLDIPRLDTLVMATPKGDIVQASGRIQRKHPMKHAPLIIDVVDSFSVFEALRWKRWNFYRQEKFLCQTYAITADAEWFV